MNNIFAPPGSGEVQVNTTPEPKVRKVALPNYSASPCGLLDHIIAFLIGFVAGFAVLFIFYKAIIVSIIGGVIVGVVYIFVAEQNAIAKRKTRLRMQFFDLLEAMSVAMRAGNPMLKALQSARNDLVMIYQENSDIITQLDIIILKFNNAVPLSASFSDFAERSGLEDIASFASIYATIEGKSSRADEINDDCGEVRSQYHAVYAPGYSWRYRLCGCRIYGYDLYNRSWEDCCYRRPDCVYYQLYHGPQVQQCKDLVGGRPC